MLKWKQESGLLTDQGPSHQPFLAKGNAVLEASCQLPVLVCSGLCLCSDDNLGWGCDILVTRHVTLPLPTLFGQVFLCLLLLGSAPKAHNMEMFVLSLGDRRWMLEPDLVTVASPPGPGGFLIQLPSADRLQGSYRSGD